MAREKQEKDLEYNKRKNSNITIDVIKRRSKFYWHKYKLSTIRPPQETHDMTSTLNNSPNLVIENREDIRNANIKQEEIIDHHKFRNGTHSNTHVGRGYKPKW